MNSFPSQRYQIEILTTAYIITENYIKSKITFLVLDIMENANDPIVNVEIKKDTTAKWYQIRSPTEDNNSSIDTKSEKWYPGKFLGVKNKNANDEKTSRLTSESDLTSENLSKRNDENAVDDDKWYPGKYIGRKKSEGSVESDKKGVECDGESVNNDDDPKKEAMIVYTARSIRLKYLQRQLIGKIFIYRLSGVISTAMTLEVTSNDITDYLLRQFESGGASSVFERDTMIQAELTGQYKRALSITDTILNSLERRSLAWDGADFAHTALLTRGSTIGVSDPFLGIIGFSFTIELSATAHSLLASRRRYEASKDLALSIHEPSRPSLMETLSRYMSMSDKGDQARHDHDHENDNEHVNDNDHDNGGGGREDEGDENSVDKNVYKQPLRPPVGEGEADDSYKNREYLANSRHKHTQDEVFDELTI